MTLDRPIRYHSLGTSTWCALGACQRTSDAFSWWMACWWEARRKKSQLKICVVSSVCTMKVNLTICFESTWFVVIPGTLILFYRQVLTIIYLKFKKQWRTFCLQICRKNSYSSRTTTGSMFFFDMETPKTDWIHSEVETGLTHTATLPHGKWQLKRKNGTTTIHYPCRKEALSSTTFETNLLVSCQLDCFCNSTSPTSLEPVGKVLGRWFCCSKMGKRW